MQFNTDITESEVRTREPLRPFGIGDRVVVRHAAGGFYFVTAAGRKQETVAAGSEGVVLEYEPREFAPGQFFVLVLLDGLLNQARFDGLFNFFEDELKKA